MSAAPTTGPTHSADPKGGTFPKDDSTSNTAGFASAKDEAANVAEDTKDATKHVARTAKEQAGNVASEAQAQAKDLYTQTRSELADQAGVQQKRVATGLHSMSDELGTMAQNSTEKGVATDLVRQASERVSSIADWLDARDPGSLFDEVKGYASRKPGTFIAIAAAAGILAGRLTRSATSAAADTASATTDRKAQSHVSADVTTPEARRAESTAQASAYATVLPTTPAYADELGYVSADESDAAFSSGVMPVSPRSGDIGTFPTDADFDTRISESRSEGRSQGRSGERDK